MSKLYFFEFYPFATDPPQVTNNQTQIQREQIMKNKLFLRLLMATFVAAGTTSAYAANQTLDFTGFTVSFDNSQLSMSSSNQYLNQVFDFSKNYNSAGSFDNTTLTSGVNASFGNMYFADPNLSAEASGVNGASSQSTSFSFSVQAKSGWGIANTYTAFGGDWTQNYGGATAVSSSTTGPGGGYASYYDQLNGKNFQSGYWQAFGNTLAGNGYNAISTNLYDAADNYIGYRINYTTDPLNASNLTSTTELNLTATTSAVNQYALAETNGQLFFSVSAYEQFAAPVPEPETYAMLMAGLGLIGFTLRRRKTT